MQPLWLKSPRFLSLDESMHLETSGTPVVSPLDELRSFQPQIMTMATLHEASRYRPPRLCSIISLDCFFLLAEEICFCHRQELLDHLRTARQEKRRLHQALREFEEHFHAETGR